MPIKKIIILAVSILLFFVQSKYLYNMYSGSQDNKLVENICYEIQAFGSIEGAQKIAIKQGADYYENDSQITISKNKYSCTLYTKDGKILNNISKTYKP